MIACEYGNREGKVSRYGETGIFNFVIRISLVSDPVPPLLCVVVDEKWRPEENAWRHWVESSLNSTLHEEVVSLWAIQYPVANPPPTEHSGHQLRRLSLKQQLTQGGVGLDRYISECETAMSQQKEKLHSHLVQTTGYHSSGVVGWPVSDGRLLVSLLLNLPLSILPLQAVQQLYGDQLIDSPCVQHILWGNSDCH